MKSLLIPAILIFLSLGAALLLSRQISVLCLGDSLASSLGIQVKRPRMICLICSSASAAAVVSFAGLLGFVGLIVPHIARAAHGCWYDEGPGWFCTLRSRNRYAGRYPGAHLICPNRDPRWDCYGGNRRSVLLNAVVQEAWACLKLKICRLCGEENRF